jgi:CrcB protein
VGIVALGGALGALARTSLTLQFAPQPGAFPWVTLLENLTGAFALGVVLVVLARRSRPVWAGPFLATGLLGSYTTFATMGLELSALSGRGGARVAVAYLVSTAVLGLTAAACGVALGRRLGPARVPA